MLNSNVVTYPAIRKRPIRKHSMLRLDDFFVWGGSMTRVDNGKCHIFFSLWHRAKGFDAWVTDSKIAYATADTPLGPYKFKKIILPSSGKADRWDRDVTHNPTVLQAGGKFYLYYMGNRGNGDWWTHRNNQRIGVAVADNIEDPWECFDQPLLDVSANNWDCTMTSNPSVTQMPDGRFIMIYKGVGGNSPSPQYGPVLHGVAFSDSPLGPFIKHPKPIFMVGDAAFPGEDPCLFLYRGKLYTILKDMGTYYSPKLRSLVLFESVNGIDWKLSNPSILSTRNLEWEDGRKQMFFRLERPQLYLEDGFEPILFVAALPDKNSKDSFNIHYEVELSNLTR